MTEHYESFENLSPEELYRRAIDGAIIAVGYADQLLNQAINELGADKEIEYPDTAYEVPVVYGFSDFEVHKLSDLPQVIGYARKHIVEVPTLENAMIAGESTLFAAEVRVGREPLRPQIPRARVRGRYLGP